MCCRYSFGEGGSDERAKKILSLMERDFPGQYKTGEIYPGDAAAAILGENGRLRHAPAVFGFPGFGDKKLILNARAETVAEKPTFASAFKARRAVLPADGFYEWSRGADKTKYLFTLDMNRTLYLCGVYRETDGVFRFVILTRPANASISDVHDRMPVIAAADEVRPYLTDLNAATNLIALASPKLRKRPVDADPVYPST